MKTKYKISLLLFSLFLIGAGLLVKNYSGPSLKVTAGLVAGDSTNLIKTLYPQIPIYPDATIASVLEKNNTVVVSLQSKDDPQVISDYYQKKLFGEKWLGGPKDYAKEDKELSVDVTQNSNKTQTAVVLNYSFVPTK